jgi:hypothetical protein
MGMSSTDWELAALKEEAFEVYYGKDEDVATFLENIKPSQPASGENPSKE